MEKRPVKSLFSLTNPTNIKSGLEVTILIFPYIN